MADRVLVTGGSGFLGSHVILAALAAGYDVRTTVRSLAREADVRAMLAVGGAEPGARLSFAVADLSKDEGWDEAVRGCAYVHHVASPFPPSAPKHEDELIVPAREGALRVLRASKAAGVTRVVLTSSFAAIGYSAAAPGHVFTEADWTDPNDPRIRAYTKSKTLAEKAAWDFVAKEGVAKEGGSVELSVVNPVAILGPVLGPDLSTSIVLVELLMKGAMPGCPQLVFGVVDVRDVADLHMRAMLDPKAKGERFLAVSGDFMPIVEMATTLRARLGEKARRVPTRVLPNVLVRAASLFDPALRQITGELGKRRNGSSRKARDVLGWSPRSREDALVATAESLAKIGVLPA